MNIDFSEKYVCGANGQPCTGQVVFCNNRKIRQDYENRAENDSNNVQNNEQNID